MEWPEETVARLRVLWDEGLSTADIGRRLGVSKNAVVGKAHRLDLPERPSPIIRNGETRPKPTRVPRVHQSSLPLLSSLSGSTPAPEPRKAYVPKIRHPEAPMARPTPATRVWVGPPKPCCWPIGDPKNRETFRFCCDPAEPGRPYCHEHVKLAYVKVGEQRQDAA